MIVHITMSMKHDYETGVALSDSVNKTCLERPLAEKLQWRHFRLAINPRYLGNHGSQIKSYYGTLSGSNGRSFRIRHEKKPETPPGGGITMTSYPVCNKTSLSRKSCIPDTNLLWNAIRESWSLSQNPSSKIAWSAPWRKNHDNIISGWQYKLIRYLGNHVSQIKKLLWNAIRKSWSLFQNMSWICHEK